MFWGVGGLLFRKWVAAVLIGTYIHSVLVTDGYLILPGGLGTIDCN